MSMLFFYSGSSFTAALTPTTSTTMVEISCTREEIAAPGMRPLGLWSGKREGERKRKRKRKREEVSFVPTGEFFFPCSPPLFNYSNRKKNDSPAVRVAREVDPLRVERVLE